MDLYKILGVKTTATQKQIKKAYYAKSKIHHPDQGGDPEMFKQLVHAYGILSDPEKRKRYDSGESADDILRTTMTFDQEVMTSLCGLFVQIVAQSNVDKTDLVALMKQHIQRAVGDFGNNIKAQNMTIEKFNSALNRMKTKNENNLFSGAANSQIKNCELNISKIQHQIDIGLGAIKFLDAFSYEFDPAAVDAMAPKKRRGSKMFFQFNEDDLNDD